MSRYFSTLLESNEVDACFLPEDEKSSSDSEEIDSDVEFHLYSQLHYSSHFEDKDLREDGSLSDCDVTSSDEDVDEDLPQKAGFTDDQKVGPFNREDIERLKEYLSDDEVDFVPESWEIVDSVGSDDEDVDIHINVNEDSITEEEIDELDTSVEVSEDLEDLWKIDERDRAGFKAESRGRYYSDEPQSRMRCKNCDDTGHMARNCPAEKKKPVCFMCGNRGHMGKDCPERRNQRFANRRAVCNRCSQEGHVQKECPDLWRQFHLTTDIGPIVLPDNPDEATDNVQCPNCAVQGHFVDECPEERDFYNRLVQCPFVYWYDEHFVVKPASDFGKKQNRSQQKSKGTYAGGKSVTPKKSRHTVFSSSPEAPQRNKQHHKAQSQPKNQRKNHYNESRSRHCDYDKSYRDDTSARNEHKSHKKQHGKRTWSESQDFNCDDYVSNERAFKRPGKTLTKREQLLRLMDMEKSRARNEPIRSKKWNVTDAGKAGSSRTPEIVHHNSRNVVFREPITPRSSDNRLVDSDRPFPRSKNNQKKGGYNKTSGQRDSSQKFDRGFKRKYR